MKILIIIFISIFSAHSFAQIVLNCDIDNSLQGEASTKITLDSQKTLQINEPDFTLYGDMYTLTLSNGDEYTFQLTTYVQGGTIDFVVGGNDGYWALSLISFHKDEVPSTFNMQVGINNVPVPYQLNITCSK